MKKWYWLLMLLGMTAAAQKPTLPGKQGKKVLLPNGWSLSPAGRSLPLGDLPLNLAVSADKKWLAVTNNGQSTQTIQLIDIRTEKELDRVVIPRSWYGLKFSSDNRYLYASGGFDNRIVRYTIEKNKLRLTDSILLGPKWPVKIDPSGIELDDKKKVLYVVTKENNQLYFIDLNTKSKTDSLSLPGEAFTCVLSPDKNTLYISCWGCDKLLVVSLPQKKIISEIKVGDNPNELALTKNGRRLFVANANDNSVSVIDTRTRWVVETLNAALYPNAPSGSTSNGVALSEDEKSLFIANADNNCLAVFDITKPAQSRPLGYIPVGWYPTNVKVVGKKILVANGKGFSSLPNPMGPNPTVKSQKVWYQNGDSTKPMSVQYIAGLFKGTLSIIDQPSAWQLSEYSKTVYANTPYTKTKELNAQGIEKGNPVPSKVGDASPIKYVFYVIKENRTYDQVLGDMKEGNGDSSLVLFGENITPNQHALAREFVLLDNFYVDAEVSADGHNWSLGGYATDYLEKTWPTSYGGRGGDYSAEGHREIANNKNGFIWNNAARHGLSFRTYGEFADNYKPNLPVLKGHYCPYYTGWDVSVRDTTRFFQWKRDFDSLLRINQVPRLNTLRLINDHTEGLRLNRPSPYAHVADNDLAVGMLVEYLSRSPIWNECAIFIIEDDAQNGADHVDAHRSTAYVAGGRVKRGLVDHTMYSTTSLVRTIELILGMKPMSQYTAAATPMWRCFQAAADTTGFRARPNRVELSDRTTVMSNWQQRSERFNLSKEDAVPDLEFNIVLWHAIKGDIPFPGPKRAAFVKLNAEDDDEEEENERERKKGD